jgi:hypothetical protein
VAPEQPGDPKKQRLPLQATSDPSAVIVDIGSGDSSFALAKLDLAELAAGRGPLVQTEYGPAILDGSRTRSDLTWEHAMPETHSNSAVVFGDPLQTMNLMFGEHGVKRVFINNVNAKYDSSLYDALAKVLVKTMTKGGTVEVQWTDAPEYPNGLTGDRGHIDGIALEAALTRAGHPITPTKEAPIPFDYGIKPSTRANGIDPKEDVPTSPEPQYRYLFTF